MRTLISSLGLAFITAALTACGPDASTAGVHAASTVAQASPPAPDSAAQIIGNLATEANSYIPFGFVSDGCYARALYMSMALATAPTPIASGAVYALPKTPELSFGPAFVPDGWRYHVTVATGPETIWDPTLQTGSVTTNGWLALMSTSLDTVRLVRVQGATYIQALPRDDFGNFDLPNLPADVAITTFEAMPAFHARDIDHACKAIAAALPQDPERATNLSVRLKRLTSETKRMVQVLKSRGKLIVDPELTGKIRCAGRSIKLQ